MQAEQKPTWLDLYDYRTRVAEMYRQRAAALRAGEDAETVLRRFRAQKDELFARHPQSPFDPEQRRAPRGLRYFPYDPQFQVEAVLETAGGADEEPPDAPSSLPGAFPLRRAGRLRFLLLERELELAVYWIDVYGGGLFLPFRDATSAQESYGGGRYLFDTVKGSDFLQLPGGELEGTEAEEGYSGGPVLLDFNYAYNPSCAYNLGWACPLAPRENWLSVPVRAGERKYRDE